MSSKFKWRDQYKTIENASNFHKQIQELLQTDSILSNFSCYQEINLQDLIEGYPYPHHHFDWYIKELNLIVELHGQQHYKPINYGNVAFDLAVNQFQRIQERDNTKMQAALNAGYDYVAISFKERKKLSYKRLKEILFNV